MPDPSSVPPVRPGLRERKKRRTRQTIARVALELFLQQGFHTTTIKQIADAADVAPRTVSAYFPVKEELLFPDHEAVSDELARRLRHRHPGETAIDALRAWLLSYLAEDGADVDELRRRRRVIAAEPALRTYERGLQEHAEQLIAAAVAVDMGVPPTDLLPRMVAAATIAALDAIGQDVEHLDDDVRRHSLALIEQAMTFIASGVRGLLDEPGSGAP